MVVRLRFRTGPEVEAGRTKNQQLALRAASLIVPMAFAAWVLTFWKIASDLGAAGAFGFAHGVRAHWQFWLGSALLLTFACTRLNRYGRRPREGVTQRA